MTNALLFAAQLLGIIVIVAIILMIVGAAVYAVAVVVMARSDLKPAKPTKVAVPGHDPRSTTALTTEVATPTHIGFAPPPWPDDLARTRPPVDPQRDHDREWG